MADFSLTTVVVNPVGGVPIVANSTQDLLAGEVGCFLPNYVATATPSTGAYFYIAQGRDNTYLQGTKRSDKIDPNRITEWYKVVGCPDPVNQITDLTNWSVQCDDVVTVTLRGHSSYLDTLYFNGFTRSVTVNAPCCDCGDDPCVDVDIDAFIDAVIAKFEDQGTDAENGDNISFNDFYTFENIGGTTLRITGKPVTKYGVPCDIAAFPHEYDRLWFAAFVYEGPATTADFIVYDECDLVATATTWQNSNYATGTSEEIYQLEINYHSYQAGYLKHLYRMAGYNQNFESLVTPGTTYDTYYIKFNEHDRSLNKWGDYIITDSMIIFAVAQADAAAFEAILVDALGAVSADNECITTTTTTTV